jgi:hypothetical protein
MLLGYCTNVHAGANLQQTRANLERYAVEVRKRFRPQGRMGVGLWFSAAAASELEEPGRLEELAAWLDGAGLDPYTLNGFPYGDFHEKVVKHRVYLPTWMDLERLEYSLALSRILHRLLPPGREGSISTLPLAWGKPQLTSEQFAKAAGHLQAAARELAKLESETGRLIHLDIESEPGCALERSEQVVRFFEDYLLSGEEEALVRRHVRVCHDVCHAAVMFEPQREALARYRAAGIAVGKVQISSAVRAAFDERAENERAAAAAQLAAFSEERYLHQTMIRRGAGQSPVFYEDLPLALAQPPEGEWRVHFHVPIFVERFGQLEATQSDILEALEVLLADGKSRHYEVETYAWGVLPAELRQVGLAEGIAMEMEWLEGRVASDK